jgi:hypothetical protein
MKLAQMFSSGTGAHSIKCLPDSLFYSLRLRPILRSAMLSSPTSFRIYEVVSSSRTLE